MARAPNPRPQIAAAVADSMALDSTALLDVRQLRHEPIQLDNCGFFADACGRPPANSQPTSGGNPAGAVAGRSEPRPMSAANCRAEASNAASPLASRMARGV